jgi:hypothetical protein
MPFSHHFFTWNDWQREFQNGAFMIMCLRCHRDTLEDQSVVQQIIDDLQDPQAMELIRKALCERKRRPFAEFPIVGGADLQDAKELMPIMFGQLQEILGLTDRFEVGKTPPGCVRALPHAVI